MFQCCTLFDSNYLSRGLAMYRSLAAWCPDFHLTIFAFDERCDRILRTLALPHTTVISLKEFEDAELLRVKPGRSKAEYCWTSTSSTLLYMLEKRGLSECTYIDADILFYRSPGVMLEEMGRASILLTEHRYTSRYDVAALSGKYCVQFITFRKDTNGLRALRWWRDRCIEWCFDRNEDGKFGDQKYLDDWTTRFEGVHVLRHQGGGVAPWNVQQYALQRGGEHPVIRKRVSGEAVDLVFYHFHYLRFYEDGTVDLGDYQLAKELKEQIYRPYVQQLWNEARGIRKIDATFNPHGLRPYVAHDGVWINKLKRMIKGQYNIVPLSWFSLE